MDTREFKTRTIFEKNTMPVYKSPFNPIGLDIGYSGTKVMSETTVCCFPSYATCSDGMEGIELQGVSNDSILYMDENGKQWIVGEAAQNSILLTDTSSGSLSIYERSRWDDPMVLVIARVGIAAGMRDVTGKHLDKPLVVQTGLPPKYYKADKADLLRVFTGVHNYKVKFGNGPWESFQYYLDERNLLVLDQPMGTYYALSRKKDLQLSPEASILANNNVLVIDPGFGTLDIFPVRNGKFNRAESATLANLGMKRVFMETSNMIFDEYGTEIPVPAFQRYLESGVVPMKQGRTYVNAEFKDMLEKASKKVCYEAIEKIYNDFNPTLNYRYIVLTGGTGAAWAEYFREHEFFKDCTTTQIIAGNKTNPDLEYIFANSLGYYIVALSASVSKQLDPQVFEDAIVQYLCA